MGNEGSPHIQQTPDGKSGAGIARRSLLRGGLVAGPLAMTVSAKSVMAQSGSARCTTASAYGSINASRPSRLSHCSGRSPSFWSNSQNFHRWPSGFVPVGSGSQGGASIRATLFRECFPASQGVSRQTLLEVLSTTGGGRDEVARLCAAAMLNASAGWTPPQVLDATVLRDVWASFNRRGYFEPTAGVRWFADSSMPAGTGGIVEWLSSTMPRG